MNKQYQSSLMERRKPNKNNLTEFRRCKSLAQLDEQDEP